MHLETSEALLTGLPEWPEEHAREDTLPELRLRYLRVGCLAPACVNPVSEPEVLPNLAVPLSKVCALLDRRPEVLRQNRLISGMIQFVRASKAAPGTARDLPRSVP
jgi:hypothetical protein